MKVTDAAVTPVVAPLDRAISGSHYEKAERGTAVVRVETDGDVVGEAYSASVVGTPDRRATVVRLLREDLLPMVRGQELHSIEATWEAMFALVDRYMPSGKGERSLLMHAIAAVDAALWDAIGKAAGVPLYRLWGGYRASVPVIGIGGYYAEGKTDDDLVAEMREYEAMGLGGVKLKVGGESIERDLERLAAVRAGTEPGFTIACDANGAYTVEEAVAFAEGAEPHDVTWFEEPVRWQDQYRGMAAVRRRTAIPVAAGQSEHRAAGIARLLEGDCIDVCNFDAMLGCGPTEWLRAAELARHHGVTMVHHEQPAVAMHLLAALPHTGSMEVFHPDADPLWYGMVANRPDFDDGRVHLPDRPGLGIELDEGFIAEHRVDD